MFSNDFAFMYAMAIFASMVFMAGVVILTHILRVEQIKQVCESLKEDNKSLKEDNESLKQHNESLKQHNAVLEERTTVLYKNKILAAKIAFDKLRTAKRTIQSLHAEINVLLASEHSESNDTPVAVVVSTAPIAVLDTTAGAPPPPPPLPPRA
jgi:cell division protein FtsB